MMMEKEYVYIMKFSNCIKIGYTTRPIKKRIAEVENASGKLVEDIFYISGSREIESKMHSIYSDYRGKGEYFFVSYDEAVERLKKFKPTPTSEHDNILSTTMKQCAYAKNYISLKNVFDDIEKQGHVLPKNLYNKIRSGKLDFQTLALFLEQVGCEIIFREKSNLEQSTSYFISKFTNEKLNI